MLALTAMAAVVGLVFMLQGLGAPIGRSFMVGDPLWAAIGIGLLAVAGVVAARELRRG